MKRSALSVALLAVLWGGVAWAQTAKPSMAVVPLEIEPHPSLKKVEAELRNAWFDGLRDSGKLLLPTKRELEAANASLKNQNCRESNECMTQLSVRAGTLYAIYGEVGYSETKVVSITARVVRDDGKVMGSSVALAPRGKDTIVEVAKRLYLETFEKLKLTELATFKEAVPDSPRVKNDPDPIKKDPEQLLPMPPIVDTAAGQRTAGKALVIGGAVVLAGGIGLAVAGCGFGCPTTPNGPGLSIPRSQLESAATGRSLMTVGFVGAGLGAAATVVGAVILGTAPSAPVQSVTVVPVAGGGVVQIGGRF